MTITNHQVGGQGAVGAQGPAGPGAGYTFINTYTANNQANFDVPIDGLFDDYMLLFKELKPVTNTDILRMKLGFGGPVVFTSDSAYEWRTEYMNTHSAGPVSGGNGAPVDLSANTDSWLLADSYPYGGVTGRLHLYGATSAVKKRATWELTYLEGNGVYFQRVVGLGMYATLTDPVTSLRLTMPTHGVLSGKVVVYGIKTS